MPATLAMVLSSQELIRKTKDSVVKEKEDEDARLKSQAKRLDYITRALRIEEMPVLRKKYEAQVKELNCGMRCCVRRSCPSIDVGFSLAPAE